MKSLFSTVVSLLVLSTSVAFASTTEPAEQELIRRHLTDVETYLRARDVSDWAAAKRTARRATLDALTQYRDRGEFPRNVDFRDARVPHFVDDQGTSCAVAYLMIVSGYEEAVREIVATENNAYVMEMTSDLAPWLEFVGLTAEEASWIQPSYNWDQQPKQRTFSDESQQNENQTNHPPQEVPTESEAPISNSQIRLWIIFGTGLLILLAVGISIAQNRD